MGKIVLQKILSGNKVEINVMKLGQMYQGSTECQKIFDYSNFNSDFATSHFIL